MAYIPLWGLQYEASTTGIWLYRRGEAEDSTTIAIVNTSTLDGCIYICLRFDRYCGTTFAFGNSAKIDGGQGVACWLVVSAVCDEIFDGGFIDASPDGCEVTDGGAVGVLLADGKLQSWLEQFLIVCLRRNYSIQFWLEGVARW